MKDQKLVDLKVTPKAWETLRSWLEPDKTLSDVIIARGVEGTPAEQIADWLDKNDPYGAYTDDLRRRLEGEAERNNPAQALLNEAMNKLLRFSLLELQGFVHTQEASTSGAGPGRSKVTDAKPGSGDSVRELLESYATQAIMLLPRAIEGEDTDAPMDKLTDEFTNRIEELITTSNAELFDRLTQKHTKNLLGALQVAEREARIAGAKAFVEFDAGQRCETKDTHDFPEIKNDPKASRCYCCEMWEHFDEWLESTDKETE